MFLVLFIKILYLYMDICVGFIAGKVIKSSGEEMAKFVFFLIAPIVYFRSAANVEISGQLFFLPIIVFAICSTMTHFVYHMSKFLYKGSVRNILAFSSGGLSSGFFGIPVAISLFDQRSMSFYIIGAVGAILYENTHGLYVVTKGIYTPKECVMRMIKAPSLWGTIIGLLMAGFHIKLPEFSEDFFTAARETFSFIGMSLLGISISKIKTLKFDFKFIIIICFTKYVLWPSLVIILVYLDTHFTKFYDHDMYRALILLSIVPASSSSIIFANVFNNNPDTVAVMLVINTIIGLFYLPMMVSLFIY